MSNHDPDIVRNLKIELKRTARIGLASDLTIEEWMEAIRYFGGKCAYCNARPFESMDHVTPISKGGGTTKNNCLPACKSCNSKKGNRPLGDHPALVYFGDNLPPPYGVIPLGPDGAEFYYLSQTAGILQEWGAAKFGISKNAVIDMALEHLAEKWGYHKTHANGTTPKE